MTAWGHGYATEAGAAVLRWADEASASRWCCAPRPQRPVPRPGRRGSASPSSHRFEEFGAEQWFGVRHAGLMVTSAARPPPTRRDSYVVELAYAPYLPRMGGARPGPMDTDYAAAVADTEAWVAVDGRRGRRLLLLLVGEADAMLLENVAVLPSHHGPGVGRASLALAEGRAGRAGHSIRLYTHEIDGREPAALRADRLRRDTPGGRARIHAGLLREAARSRLGPSREWSLTPPPPTW